MNYLDLTNLGLNSRNEQSQLLDSRENSSLKRKPSLFGASQFFPNLEEVKERVVRRVRIKRRKAKRQWVDNFNTVDDDHVFRRYGHDGRHSEGRREFPNNRRSSVNNLGRVQRIDVTRLKLQQSEMDLESSREIQRSKSKLAQSNSSKAMRKVWKDVEQSREGSHSMLKVSRNNLEYSPENPHLTALFKHYNPVGPGQYELPSQTKQGFHSFFGDESR